MNWKTLIKQLQATGYTETQIAEVARTSQPTINRLKKGVVLDPGYELGRRLVALRDARA